jgi:hypothetical protein
VVLLPKPTPMARSQRRTTAVTARPHIAQVICGHKSLDTRMGFKAIYPAETIEAHRAFIAHHRATRPSDEDRTPTEEEWDAFLGHFEERKVSIGTCARAFSSPCVREHACVRCSLLRQDPAERSAAAWRRSATTSSPASPRPSAKAARRVEGLRVSLAGAEDKLTQIDRRTPGGTAINRGMPRISPARPVREEEGTAALRHSVDDQQ